MQRAKTHKKAHLINNIIIKWMYPEFENTRGRRLTDLKPPDNKRFTTFSYLTHKALCDSSDGESRTEGFYTPDKKKQRTIFVLFTFICKCTLEQRKNIYLIDWLYWYAVKPYTHTKRSLQKWIFEVHKSLCFLDATMNTSAYLRTFIGCNETTVFTQHYKTEWKEWCPMCSPASSLCWRRGTAGHEKVSQNPLGDQHHDVTEPLAQVEGCPVGSGTKELRQMLCR